MVWVTMHHWAILCCLRRWRRTKCRVLRRMTQQRRNTARLEIRVLYKACPVDLQGINVEGKGCSRLAVIRTCLTLTCHGHMHSEPTGLGSNPSLNSHCEFLDELSGLSKPFHQHIEKVIRKLKQIWAPKCSGSSCSCFSC